jgi:hypothetical protein
LFNDANNRPFALALIALGASRKDQFVGSLAAVLLQRMSPVMATQSGHFGRSLPRCD